MHFVLEPVKCNSLSKADKNRNLFNCKVSVVAHTWPRLCEESLKTFQTCQKGRNLDIKEELVSAFDLEKALIQDQGKFQVTLRIAT